MNVFKWIVSVWRRDGRYRLSPALITGWSDNY